jgi:SOS response regulatory protein OraA/RecX
MNVLKKYDLKSSKTLENYIIRVLTKKDYSESEIRKKALSKYTNSEKYIDDIIAKFKGYDYIDDNRYAKSIVRQKYNSYYGINRIKSTFFEKGLDFSIVIDYIDELDFFEKALEYKEMKYSEMDIKDYKVLSKYKNKMLYRGYSYDEINSTL